MKTVTALLIAIAMTCAVAAQAAGPTREEAQQALVSPFVAGNGVIRVHSQVGDVSGRVIERWSRNWRAIKRGLERWTGVQVPNFPPEPTDVYLLTPENQRTAIAPTTCPGQCFVSHYLGPGGIAVSMDWNSPYDNRLLEVKLAQGSMVPHEMLHKAFGAIYEGSEAQLVYGDTRSRNPYLATLAREAVARLNAEMGPDPAPGVFRPERYERLKAIVMAKMWLAQLPGGMTLFPLNRAEENYRFYLAYGGETQGASPEEWIASVFFVQLTWTFNVHNWGSDHFGRISSYFWHEANNECRADGAC